MRRLLAAGLLAVIATVAAACDDGIDEPSSKVFVAPPWDGKERYTYELEQEGVEEAGTCVIETLPDGETTNLNLLCSNGENTDEAYSIVESGTLIPIDSERSWYDPEDDVTNFVAARFHPPTVTIEFEGEDDDRSRERDLPEPSDDEPEPGYYVDPTLLWVLRGIPLEEGWKGAFHDISPTALVHIFKVEVEVAERETIDVPLGTFDTWRVRFRSPSITQYVWVEVEEPHRVIQAQLDTTRFRLAASE